MKKIIEVEMRGTINDEYRSLLVQELKTNGVYKGRKERVLIDYTDQSQELSERQVDIRIRNTNKVSEIIIKTGSWGGVDSRKEYSIKSESPFDTLVQVYKFLGYKKGILCVRNIETYEYMNIEIAIVEVPNHSFYFEAEIEVENESEIDEAKSRISKALNILFLKPFSDDEYFSYIEKLNQEANILFDADKVNESFFREKYAI